jgi:pepF/M3 family oligoendopeptidase
MIDVAPSWNLESLFIGGVEGDAFARARTEAEAALAALDGLELPPLEHDPGAWVAILRQFLSIELDIQQIQAFAGCVWSTDAGSTEARLAEGACRELYGRWQTALVAVDASLDAASDATFAAFIERPDATEMAPWLRNRRALRHLRLDPPRQRLMRQLNREALHGWGGLYTQLSGRLTATVETPAGPTTLGVAQLNGLLSSPDEPTRRAAHEAGQRAWGEVTDLCATALTHITGARQTHLDEVQADELEPTLTRNRLTRATLEAMLEAVQRARPTIVRYLHAKARLLNKPQLDWWDMSAPLPVTAGASVRWSDAVAQVDSAFRAFDPSMADFARRAVDSGWVEAEARGNKRQGAYCTGLPHAGESRVFMTWGGTQRTAMTLAHELGHAWHNEVLLGQPPARRKITSATAETASTFAEALYRDAAIEAAPSAEIRRVMIDQQLLAGANMLMNLPARFEFERELYTLRRRGQLDPAELCEVMVQCQRVAHGDALQSWNPTFWASKLHYYISGFSFYNWPYTFGYLFSSAVHARAVAEGPAFAPSVRALLADMGHATTEDVVRNTLGEDITDVAFWTRATAPLLAKIEEFVAA